MHGREHRFASAFATGRQPSMRLHKAARRYLITGDYLCHQSARSILSEVQDMSVANQHSSTFERYCIPSQTLK